MTSEESTEATAPVASLDGTIWAEVDRALSGITATAERGVLDVIVHVPPAEIVRALHGLQGFRSAQGPRWARAPHTTEPPPTK